MITDLINVLIYALSTFLTGTAYFAIFFFWCAVISYYLRKQGYVIGVKEVDAESSEEEKTEK